MTGAAEIVLLISLCFCLPAAPSEFGKVCDAYTFQCSNGVCVSLRWKCDGTDDCGDYSDEANCGGFSETHTHTDTHTHIHTHRYRHLLSCVLCVTLASRLPYWAAWLHELSV